MNYSPSFLKLFKVLLISLLVLDIGYLNYKLLDGVQPSTSKNDMFKKNSENLLNENLPQRPFLNTQDVEVGSEIKDLVREATASLTLQIESLTDKVDAGNVATTKTTTSAPSVKEFYIPLGTGATNSQAWVDLVGIEANVAPANYGKIKEMYFEASIWIPNGTGRVYGRLINVTDNNPLIESEVYREGTSTGIISSGKIPVPTNTKLYRVQLRSTLGTEVKLDNARIKIVI